MEFPTVAALDVAHGTHRYLFLVNSSNDPVRVVVQGLPRTAIMAENLFETGDRRLIRPGQWEPDLEPLEVKAFRFSPTDMK